MRSIEIADCGLRIADWGTARRRSTARAWGQPLQVDYRNLNETRACSHY